VVLKAAVIDRRYQWVVTLEASIVVGTDDVPVVPRKVVRLIDLLGVLKSDYLSFGTLCK
jgi:hypothetical protein